MPTPDDRALSSDEAVLSVTCAEDEAILEWSNGELAVEYITLEYSCLNHTGNTSSNVRAIIHVMQPRTKAVAELLWPGYEVRHYMCVGIKFQLEKLNQLP